MNYTKKMIVLGCSFWYAKARYVTAGENEENPDKLQIYIKAYGNFYFRLLNECDGAVALAKEVLAYCLTLITDGPNLT